MQIPKGYKLHPLYSKYIEESMKGKDCGISATLAERGNRYGEFKDHARICQQIKDIVSDTVGWEAMTCVERQALEVIIDKIARMCNGDPHYIDNWHDIQGYAKLVEVHLQDFPM